MAILNEPLYKHLAASGAVTTNAKAGILHYVVFTGATVGDILVVADGATTQITLVTSVANAPVYFEPPRDKRPQFTTDIDATITKAGNAYATFIYEEIQS